MKAILKAGTIACGLIAVGCASKMTALNSEMPSAVKGDLEGRYILEKINVGETGIDSSKLRKGILSDQVLQKTLNGATEDKQSLPVHVSVTSSKREANGGVATVNNIFVICDKRFNGFDPELGNSVMPRIFSFGLNIGF